jgi:hypothetical protein
VLRQMKQRRSWGGEIFMSCCVEVRL